MPRLAVSLVALLALIALPACDGGGPDPIGLTGVWEGEIFDPTDGSAPRYPIELRLSDNGVRVVGSGFVEDLPEGRLEFAVVDGSFFDRIVNLVLEFNAAPFRGSLNGTLTETDPGRIRGTFVGRNEARGTVEIEIVARRI